MLPLPVELPCASLCGLQDGSSRRGRVDAGRHVRALRCMFTSAFFNGLADYRACKIEVNTRFALILSAGNCISVAPNTCLVAGVEAFPAAPW